jgi:hypothetical protein
MTAVRRGDVSEHGGEARKIVASQRHGRFGLPIHRLGSARRSGLALRRGAVVLLTAAGLASGLATMLPSAGAQVLARPGWAGSGVHVEPWWRHAIFAQVTVPCAMGTACDAITPLVHRMAGLRALGVDALILRVPMAAPGRTMMGSRPAAVRDPALDAAADELVSEAARHGVRLVVELDAQVGAETLLAEARLWLVRGAGGLLLRTGGIGPAQAVALEARLREAERHAPGDHVLLLADAADIVSAAEATGSGRNDETGSVETATAAALAADNSSPMDEPHSRAASRTAASGRASSRASGSDTMLSITPFPQPLTAGTLSILFANGGMPLLAESASNVPSEDRLADPPAQRVEMAVLLLTRSTPLLTVPLSLVPEEVSAQSILDADAAKTAAVAKAAADAKAARDAAAAYDPSVFGAFHAYQAPKSEPPASANGSASAGVAQGAVPGAAAEDAEDATRAIGPAAAQESPQHAWLRRLATELRSQPSFQTGAQRVLDHDAEQALVWVRLPPNARGGAAAVFTVCNLSDQPISVSLVRDIDRLDLRGKFLRPLARTDSRTESQPLDAVKLEPHGVYVGALAR